MNDRTDELDRRLQQATAPECSPGAMMEAASMDGETASLREGWLAFGQLLEAAQPALDTSPLDASPLDASLLDGLLPLPQAAPNKASSPWKMSLAGALAASLIIGATLAWNFISNRTEVPSRPSHDIAIEDSAVQDTAVEDTDSEAPQPIPIVAENTVAENTVAENTIAENAIDELQWDDSLDDQLALVSQEIMWIEGGWDCLDDAFGPVWEGIDRIEQEIEEETL